MEKTPIIKIYDLGDSEYKLSIRDDILKSKAKEIMKEIIKIIK